MNFNVLFSLFLRCLEQIMLLKAAVVDSQSKGAVKMTFVSLQGVMSYMVLAASGFAHAQNYVGDCGSLENAFGPYDYTNPAHTTDKPGKGRSPLNLVERGHFKPQVENLVRGVSSVDPLDDLEYTLRAFPNHHRALNAMANYHLKNGLRKKGRYTIECWFARAIRFRPNDAKVRVVYGIFLAKKGSSEEAELQYKEALRLGGDMPEAHYNIGLLYTDMNQYDLAYTHAIRAYELGYPLPGLRNRLVRAGAWKANESQ